MNVVAELVSRARISDPKPAYCLGCFRSAGPDVRFIDFQASVERGSVIDPSSGAVVDYLEDLHLCEDCVRGAAEALDYKAQLHSVHLQEVRRLRLENARLEDENMRLRSLVAGEG